MDPRISQLIAAQRLQADIDAATAAREAKAQTRTRRQQPRPAGRRFVRRISTLPSGTKLLGEGSTSFGKDSREDYRLFKLPHSSGFTQLNAEVILFKRSSDA